MPVSNPPGMVYIHGDCGGILRPVNCWGRRDYWVCRECKAVLAEVPPNTKMIARHATRGEIESMGITLERNQNV